MIKAYPRLSEILPENSDTLPFIDNVLRYVCLLYDPKSPLILNERDLNYRKSIAAELANLDEDFASELHDSKIEWSVEMIMRFLVRFVKQHKWALICALEAKYWEGIKRVMQPILKGDKGDKVELQSIDIKAKISDELYKDLARLDTLWSEFFGGDRSLEDSAKNVRITPESIARS